jgi:hypothetical protein
MGIPMPLRNVWPGLLTLAVALAPAPQDPPPPPPAQAAAQAQAAPLSLADVRVQAGIKAYDLAWLYYSENRVDSEKVYRWSRRLLEAQRDAATDKAGLIAACEAHLDRIKKLEFKIRRIRRLGFGDSLDVLEVDYYRKEADFWLAESKAGRAGSIPEKLPERVDKP